jgi:hypothetical protein
MTVNASNPAKSGVFVLVVLLLLLIPRDAEGQQQDFRTWWEVDLSKDLISDLQANLDFSQRFRANSLQYDRSLLTAGLQYELFKDFDIEAGYRFYLLQNDQLQLTTKYRINGDVSYSVDIEAFKIQLRERVQYGFDDFSSIEEFVENKLTNRNKLTLEYDLFGSPVTFIGAYEIYTDLSNISAIEFSDHRIKLGIEYALSFQSQMKFTYMVDKEVNKSDPLTAHVVIIGFGYDL